MISAKTLTNLHKRNLGNIRLDVRAYYYNWRAGHAEVIEEIKDCLLWSVLVHSNYDIKVKKNMDLAPVFRGAEGGWQQFFFVKDEKKREAVAYIGNTAGSGYRFTHGIMAHAFAELDRKKKIRTYAIQYGPRGGTNITPYPSFRVHGHELRGNYSIGRVESGRIIPGKIRLYS